MSKLTLKELIDTNDSAWPIVQEWLALAKNSFEILPCSREKAENTILKLQVSNRSTMGSIALECGGILFDNGWLRFLGSGWPGLQGDLFFWNNLSVTPLENPLSGAFIIAHDIVGGFFAINGGAFNGNRGDVYYFAPDTLSWENLEKGYTDLLYWAIMGDLALFYKEARWVGWEKDSKKKW